MERFQRKHKRIQVAKQLADVSGTAKTQLRDSLILVSAGGTFVEHPSLFTGVDAPLTWMIDNLFLSMRIPLFWLVQTLHLSEMASRC